MKYYKVPGEINLRGLEEDGSQDFLIQNDWVLVPEKPSDYHELDETHTWIYNCDIHVEDRVKEVKAMLISKYQSNMPYIYDGTEYDWQVDIDSQFKVSARNSVAMMFMIDSVNFPWVDDEFRAADNQTVTFATALDFITFAKAVHDHCTTIWQASVDHKTAIRLLTDETEVTNYNIETGW